MCQGWLHCCIQLLSSSNVTLNNLKSKTISQQIQKIGRHSHLPIVDLSLVILMPVLNIHPSIHNRYLTSWHLAPQDYHNCDWKIFSLHKSIFLKKSRYFSLYCNVGILEMQRSELCFEGKCVYLELPVAESYQYDCQFPCNWLERSLWRESITNNK